MAARKQKLRGRAVRPTVDQILASRDRINRASAEFLKIDLETALTFTRIARLSSDDVRKRRNEKAARRAYETVLKLIGKIDLKDDEARAISASLIQLRSELRGLGDKL